MLVFSYLNQKLTILSDLYVKIYLTDRHPVCRHGRTTAVDERSEVSFSIPRGTLPWQPILRAKSTPPIHTLDLSSRAVREISACGEKCNRRRSVLLTGL